MNKEQSLFEEDYPPTGGADVAGMQADDAIDAAMEQQTCEKISQGAYS